jgi:hypothetical protein
MGILFFAEIRNFFDGWFSLLLIIAVFDPEKVFF